MIRYLAGTQQNKTTVLMDGILSGVEIGPKQTAEWGLGSVEILSGTRFGATLGGPVVFSFKTRASEAGLRVAGGFGRTLLTRFGVLVSSEYRAKKCEVIASGVCPGLGSFTQFDKRLNAKIASAAMAASSATSVEIGMGFEAAERTGRQVHDEYFFSHEKGFYRSTNRAGGFEGGMTTGEPICIRLGGKRFSKDEIRLAEAAVAFELANAYLEKFGGDSLAETRRNFEGFMNHIRAF